MEQSGFMRLQRVEAEVSVPSGIGRVTSVDLGQPVAYPARLKVGRVLPGELTLVLGGGGFETVRQPVVVRAGEEATVDVTLRR